MKKLFYLLLIAMASFTACKKEDLSPKVTTYITVHPDGPIGTRYSYRVYKVYDPNDFNRFDSLQKFAASYSGRVSLDTPYLLIPMNSDEFYYVVGYRCEAYTDSFYISQASGQGWITATLTHKYVIVNRHTTAGFSLPATEY